MKVNKTALEELSQNWKTSAEVTDEVVPEVNELSPVQAMGVLSKAQKICAQELDKVIDEHQEE